MIKKILFIILFSLCLSETKFYYPKNHINKSSLNSEALSNLLKTNNLIDVEEKTQVYQYLKKEKVDKFGNTHLIYQQTYNKIPVFGHYLRLHFNNNAGLSSLSSNIYSNINIDTNPQLSSNDIEEVVYNYLNTKKTFIKEPQLLIFIKDNIPILCYEIDVVEFEI